MKKTKYKSRHNKKRNTAFLYEVLIQEITKSVMGKDPSRRETALGICKKYFGKSSPLYQEREIYKSLLESAGLQEEKLGKVLAEAKGEYGNLDTKEIFNTQTQLINEINKSLDPDVLKYFVPNYKNLATIAQILNRELPVKERVLLEESFIKQHSAETKEESALEPTDALVYRTFVESYNEKYEDNLLAEQKEMITRHALSFSDNGLSLRIFLNEEIGRLKKHIKESKEDTVFKEDEQMSSKLDSVYGILENFKNNETITEDDIIRILEIQQLVAEVRL